MSDAWNRLQPHLRELHDLYSAIRLLHYDQAVSMPPRGAAGRAQAIATMESIAHDRLTDPELGELLEELRDAPLEDDHRASIRTLARDYEKATKIPRELVAALAEAGGLAYAAWTEARPADDFSILQPHLERMVSLKKQEADALGWQADRYDALLDMFEPELKTAEAEAMFAELVEGLAPLADKILANVDAAPAFLKSEYAVDDQEAFCQWLVERLGFDKTAGRLDTSPHPFTQHVGPGDVRQTTRYEKNAFFFAIYAAMHETGHALYEQGIPERLLGFPAGRIESLGLHESQSRLWENQVGRSRPFAEWVLPELTQRFPSHFASVTPDDLYEGVNHPERTLIRVSADEVTYNLHVALRFEIELALFRDQLEVADVPEAWNDAYERHLGIRPPNDRDGVLQDMHWSIGALGYFPTYTMGTLYAAAFFERAQQDLGSLDEQVAGDFVPLLQWLREKVHAQANLRPPQEIAASVTGERLSAAPFLRYIATKYGELYGVSV